MNKLLATIFLSAFLLPVAATTQAASADSIRAAIDSSQRKAEDKERDAGRKPAEVLAFLGVEPGMTALDVMASGGWYTEVLSFAVGEDGTVYAHNTPAFLQFRDGAYDKALDERLEGGRLQNVTRVNKDFDDLGLENEVDVAISALNFHDIYNRDPEAAVDMLKNIKKALKPGASFGLIDHDGKPGADNASLHRMTKEQAIDAAEKAGFEVTASDLLANPDDDHTAMVFAPEMRGKTDRFLLKLTKPE
ncbi:class I SAM-dependent methyltransferase [Gilvimarinus sp. F26214L]|uniref:class I SAM-dependent methyltransferase n=1 Tax=Gilvimarinus sp. DZF01 TaxID=3461371 RepID=UPI004045693D